MRNSLKDQAKGLFHQMRGLAKEVAGKMSGNPQLEAEGAGEKAAGKVLGEIVQLQKALGS